jgi:hypothetical protein
LNILRVFDPVALQGSEIIAVTQIREELFENRPVPITAGRPALPFQVALEVILDPVIVEEGVVGVDEKNNWARAHNTASFLSLASGIWSPARFELLVNSRSEWKAGADNISSVQRQLQLPSGRPGTFIRASGPRLSRSCRGAMARAATDDHARRIKSQATWLLSPSGDLR